MQKPLILASASPRRRDLLQMIGLDFTVRPADIPEPPLMDGPHPSLQVETLALAKARHVAGGLPGGVVLGADTVVVLDGQIMGKPADAAGAREMLTLLQGREHSVYTGVALVEAPAGKHVARHEVTRVLFRPLDKHLIRWYVRSGEPMDKAGAYGIQGLGSLLVEGVCGCYFNVVGLPVGLVARLLTGFGINIFAIAGALAGDDKR